MKLTKQQLRKIIREELQQLDEFVPGAPEQEAAQQPAGTPNPQAAQPGGDPTSPGQGDAQAGEKPAQKQASSVAPIIKLLPAVKTDTAYAQLLDAVIDHASSEHLEQYAGTIRSIQTDAREKILKILQGK